MGRWQRTAGSLGRELEELLFPSSCLSCREPGGESGLPGLCRTCAFAASRGPSATGACLDPGTGRFVPARLVAAPYRFPVPELIYRLKYGGVPSAALPLAELLARALRASDRWGRLDLLIPVPTFSLKRWSRGVDHTGLIAQELARRVRIPCWPRALRRTRATVAQGEARTVEQRARQVRGAFRARESWRLAGGRIGLVDDVWTSGATASACASALLAREAGSVLALVVSAPDLVLEQA